MIHYIYGEINRTNQSLLSVQDSDLKENLDRNLPKMIGELSQKDQILQSLIQKWYTKIDEDEIGFFSFPIHFKSNSNHLEYLIGRTYITRASGGRISYSTHVILLTAEELKSIEYNLFLISALDHTQPFEDITSLEKLFSDSKFWFKKKSEEIEKKWNNFLHQYQLDSLDESEIKRLSLMTSYIPLKLEYQKYFHVFKSHLFSNEGDYHSSLKPEVFSLLNTQVYDEEVKEIQVEDKHNLEKTDDQKQQKIKIKVLNDLKSLVISISILILLLIISIFVVFNHDKPRPEDEKLAIHHVGQEIQEIQKPTQPPIRGEENIEVSISIEDIKNYAKKTPDEIKEFLDQKDISMNEKYMNIVENIFYEYHHHYQSILNLDIKRISAKSNYKELFKELKIYYEKYRQKIENFKETFNRYEDIINKTDFISLNDFKLKVNFQKADGFMSSIGVINWNFFKRNEIKLLLGYFFTSLLISLILITILINKMIKRFFSKHQKSQTKKLQNGWIKKILFVIYLVSFVASTVLYFQIKKNIPMNEEIKISQVLNDDCTKAFEYLKNEKQNYKACIITIVGNEPKQHKIDLINPNHLDVFVRKIKFKIELDQTKQK
jgi:hypothetical protein